MKICHVSVDYIVISKLVKTKANSKYLIDIKFDKAIRPSVLIMPKMIGYLKTFKSKGDKHKSNRLMSFCIIFLLEKFKAIWTKIEHLKKIELNALPVYYDRCIKTKIRTYGHKINNNFGGLHVPKGNIEWGSFTLISVGSLFIYQTNIICKYIKTTALIKL